MNPDSAAPIIVVIGMHRSGTSLCANMLDMLGADMAGADLNIGPANPHGHWERPGLVRINDLILAYFRRQWGQKSHILAMPEHWLRDPRVQNLRARAGDWLRPHLAGARIFGFKDPRTTLLLPFWEQVFADIGADPRYVFCVRNPAQVARSLERRDAMERGQAEYRWLAYNTQAIRAVDCAPICIIPYEHWFEDPLGQAVQLALHVGLAVPARDAVMRIIDQQSRHDDPAIAPACALARRLHRMIVWNGPRPALDPDLRNLAALIDEFADQVQPLLINIEILRTSTAEQKRVIGDLQGAIKRLRAEAAPSPRVTADAA